MSDLMRLFGKGTDAVPPVVSAPSTGQLAMLQMVCKMLGIPPELFAKFLQTVVGYDDRLTRMEATLGHIESALRDLRGAGDGTEPGFSNGHDPDADAGDDQPSGPVV